MEEAAVIAKAGPKAPHTGRLVSGNPTQPPDADPELPAGVFEI
jgi:hypothetical protein